MLKNTLLSLAIVFISIAAVEADCLKKPQIYTDAPLKEGVIYADATAALVGRLKIENNCIYYYAGNSEERILPIFRDGSRLNGKEAILIRLLNGQDLYTPMGKLLVFGAGRVSEPKLDEKKKFAACLKGVNRIVRLTSHDNTIKIPAGVMKQLQQGDQ